MLDSSFFVISIAMLFPFRVAVLVWHRFSPPMLLRAVLGPGDPTQFVDMFFIDCNCWAARKKTTVEFGNL